MLSELSVEQSGGSTEKMSALSGSRGVMLSVVTGLAVVLSACTSAPPLPDRPTHRPPVYRVPVEPAEPARLPQNDSDELDTSDISVQSPDQGGAQGIYERSLPSEPETFDDSPLYSAEIQLLEDANRYADAGNLQLASASVERVLRINPRSAPALVQLAKLRLAQSAPKEAEQLLLKAISGVAYDRRSQDQHFQRQLWELVVRARRALRDAPGAQAAQARVDALR